MGAVNEVAARPVSLAALHAALRQGFGATFGVELVDMPISPEEWRLAQHLRATKYATDAWNLDGASSVATPPEECAEPVMTNRVGNRVLTALLQCLHDLCLVCPFYALSRDG